MTSHLVAFGNLSQLDYRTALLRISIVLSLQGVATIASAFRILPFYEKTTLTSIPSTNSSLPTGTTSGVVRMGRVSSQYGIREALSEASDTPYRHRQLIRVVSDNLTGLIYIQSANWIIAARTSENDVVLEGFDALRRMFSLKSGIYDLIAVEREALVRNLKQTLAVDIRTLVWLAKSHPEISMLEILEQQVRSTTEKEAAFSELLLPAGQALKFTPPLPLRDPSTISSSSHADDKPSDIFIEPERLVRISTVERYRANIEKLRELAAKESAVKPPAKDRCRTIFEVLTHVYR